MSDEDIVRTEQMTKAYGRVTAVRQLDLRIRRGEIYGFLGPNGAGKTTTVLLLLGLLRPTSGAAWLFGQPVKGNDAALKRRVGVVPEHPYTFGQMTAWEYLGFFADFYGVPHKEERMAQLLRAVDLFDRRHSYLREFSRGMQQKAGLARALLHDADLLLLDEPTSGLDPYGIKQVRDLLLSQRDRGKTILISSHILSEVERTADRVGVLVHGELQAQDTVARLIEGTQDHMAIDIELSQEVPGLADRLQALPFVQKVEVQGSNLTVWLPPSEAKDYQVALFSAIAAQGAAIVQMTSRKRTLEDAFLTLTESGALAWTERDAGATHPKKRVAL